MIFPKGNMQSVKSNGPSTEPWGTPYCTCDRYDTSSFTATNWWRSDKYDLNHANALPLMQTEFSSLFKRMLWLIVSNAALRSRSINREIQPRSDDKSRSFVTLMRAVSVLWDGLNPDWKSSQILFTAYCIFAPVKHTCHSQLLSLVNTLPAVQRECKISVSLIQCVFLSLKLVKVYT